MNKLKIIREKRGLTLEELGFMCNTSKSQIFDLEKQTSNPGIRTAYAVAAILEVDVTDIWPNEIEIIEETITIRRVKK